MSQNTDYSIDMANGEHRALVLRAYFDLLAQGEDRDTARQRAPLLALRRWRDGEDYPGFYPRRW